MHGTTITILNAARLVSPFDILEVLIWKQEGFFFIFKKNVFLTNKVSVYSRKYLGTGDLSGIVYLSSGLGGMSGAQSKAAVICGAVGVVAETGLFSHS